MSRVIKTITHIKRINAFKPDIGAAAPSCEGLSSKVQIFMRRIQAQHIFLQESKR